MVAVGLTGSEPLVTRLPLQPPEAVQLLALVEFQLKVAGSPLLIVDGVAVRFTTGTGAGCAFTVTVTLALALPPLPVQLIV